MKYRVYSGFLEWSVIVEAGSMEQAIEKGCEVIMERLRNDELWANQMPTGPHVRETAMSPNYLENQIDEAFAGHGWPPGKDAPALLMDAARELRQLRGTFSLAKEGLANYQWQPIDTAPERVEALFWIRPGTREDGDWFCDTSGNAILAHDTPRIFMGWRGGWSSLMKATHWMPLPPPPQDGKHD